ncbi:MAG: RNA pyrophosphohydrolase [Gammaproteobacteria bacterium]|nr:RNA pyrophosphohydrolase [Gammaproteobacteria bacterium]
MIDQEGYRPNVGIILTNEQGRLFWARRVGQNSWQFPQGGINERESTEEAMFRELNEETGLLPKHVEIIGTTRHWLRYDLPSRYIRRHCRPLCIGQKQIWFMLRLVGDDDCVDLSCCDKPEFDEWCWVDYWHPMSQVIFFKRQVYHQALKELAPLLSSHDPADNRAYKKCF